MLDPLKTSGITTRDARTMIWTESASPALEGRLATLYSLSNGTLGVRGTHEEMPSWASPGFYLAGSYCSAPQALIPIHSPDHILTHPERIKTEHHAEYTTLTTMPNLPNPVAMHVQIGEETIDISQVSILACERILHISQAMMTRRLVIRDRAGRKTIIDSERFVSWADNHLLAFRYTVTRDGHDAVIDAQPYINDAVSNARGLRLFTVQQALHAEETNSLTATTSEPRHVITIAQAWRRHEDDNALVVEVFVSAGVGDSYLAQAMAARDAGYDAARQAHLAAVRAAEMRSGLFIDADVLSTQGMNFGRMHLEMALCRDRQDVSVPIKGLTGEGYRFMVFWDTDFHLFPYYLWTNPAQATNLLRYRHGQLDAYRRNARHWGYRGAQVPWETGISGEEETAPWLNLQDGEIHISADVAYAVKMYDEISGDDALLGECGAELVFETARFYASRVEWVASCQRYEIRNIGCPDQYHTDASNNLFINRMAKFNLEYAAQLADDARCADARARLGVSDEEARTFAAVAAQLYLISPDAQGILEEFDGYFTRSPDLRGISETFCEHTQAVKQPDVLALFLPFGEEYSQEVLQRNWQYYDARTLHGSSLSLPGMGLAAAIAHLADDATDYFLRGARIDIDDLNLNSNLGVHLAGYGVLWQTIIFGFAGLRGSHDGIHLAPYLPRRWGSYRFTCIWHGCRLQVEVSAGEYRIGNALESHSPVPLHLPGHANKLLEPGRTITIQE